MNKIIGYVKEIIGNFNATNNLDGSLRELKLNDPIYEGDFVEGLDDDGKIIIGFQDNLEEIFLAGNDGLLFDAALLDAKFDMTDINIDGIEEENEDDSDEVDEDDEEAPSAGEEDLQDGEGDTGGIAARTGGATDVNSELSTATFVRQEPEPLQDGNEKIESHGSFSISQPTIITTPDNSTFTPTEAVVVPVVPPVIVTPPPPVIVLPPAPTPVEPPKLIDDVPEAVEDFNSIAEDSQSNTIAGNVFDNDDIGLNIPDFPVTNINGVEVGIELAGEYGTITLNQDGSYIYQLFNDALVIQELTTGESLTDVFTYTITDLDGDTSTSTLTIRIDGADDNVSLTIPDNIGGLGGDEEEVFESSLTDGSNPNNGNVVDSNFTLTALDGLQTLVVAGVNVDVADLENSTASPISITTTAGTIVLNGYDMAADGTITVDYTYTLSDNQDHSSSTVNDDFTLVVTDTDGDTTTDVLNISIVDDVPTVIADSNSLNEDSVNVSGDVFTNDTLGADQTLTPVTGVASGSSTDDVVGQLNTSVSGNYGAVVLQADGSYTYTVDNTNLMVQGLTAGESLTDTFTYTITDSDGDTATTTLTITIDGVNDGVSLTISDNVGPAGGMKSKCLNLAWPMAVHRMMMTSLTVALR